MKPETEIVPGVKGEPFATTPPPSNPTEDNPSLVSPIANPFTQPTKKTEPEGLAVDGEDRRIPGAWIQSDGGGILFEENLPPDGDDGPSG